MNPLPVYRCSCGPAAFIGTRVGGRGACLNPSRPSEKLFGEGNKVDANNIAARFFLFFLLSHHFASSLRLSAACSIMARVFLQPFSPCQELAGLVAGPLVAGST